jgi:Fe-S-cluster containining protein
MSGKGQIEAKNRKPARECGACSLCCTVLRVDELAKLGGRPCLHQLPAGGCGVHEVRPAICRAYRCAWLGGAFEADDRPDRLGAVLDLVPRGHVINLVVRQVDAGAFGRSARLREIVAEMRQTLPVELRDVDDVLDADRPYRLLQPDGDELEIAGDRVRVHRDGALVSERRASWPARGVRRIAERLRARRLRRWPSHEERLAQLGLASGKLSARGPKSARGVQRKRDEEAPP